MAQNVSIFDSLSEPQKRAVKLRDKLKYMKADHLDGYINGLGHHEPPNYRFVDGRMQPCFIEVTLLEEANRFDLGNVLFSDEIDGTQTIRRAYFFMEGCCVKMRTLKRLPLLEENLESLPIYACIVKDMEPLFEAKYRVLQARVDRFNAIRRAAHNFAYLQEACGRTEEVRYIQHNKVEGVKFVQDSAQQASHQEVLAERTRGITHFQACYFQVADSKIRQYY